MRRTAPLARFTALLGTALTVLSAPLSAAEFAGVEVPPPLQPQPVIERLWGREIADPYRFIEDSKAPAVAAWMKAQADATEAILARIPGRSALLARIAQIESRSGGSVTGAVRADSGRLFFQRRNPGENQFRLLYRDTPDGKDQLIFDPEIPSRQSGTTHALMDFSPSPDGKLVAYSVQRGGGEIGLLHVVDLASGKPVIEPLDRIRYASVSWLEDGSGFFYSRLREGFETLPDANKFGDHAVHFQSLTGNRDERAVFSSSRAPTLKLPVYAAGFITQIPGTQRVLNTVELGVERHQLAYVAELADVIAGKPAWQQIARIEDQVVELRSAPGGDLYLRSSSGAARFKVLRLPAGVTDLAKAEVIAPAGESVVTNIATTRDALYVVRRDGATQSLWKRPLRAGKDTGLQRVALPVEGSVRVTGESAQRSDLLLSLAGWTRAAKPWLLDGPTGKLTPLPLAVDGDYDAPTDITVREVRVKSHDGVEVPLSILTRTDAKLDGTLPTIVYGYGSYGSTEDPFFNPRVYAWIERGGAFAVAHVRGGGAFGEEWHLAGRKANKPNTWKDGIAVAEWLIANRYTDKSRIGIYGGSAGGILVGRAVTERPDLFAAAVPVVGTMDGLRFEFAANGVANIPEFGTVKDEAEFRALLEMSTYEHIEPKTRYPGLMFVHGVNDIRVPVSQSLKAAARFAVATTSERPVLLRLEYDSGHGQGSSRTQQQQRTTDIWTFFLWQFGVAGFQPVR